MIKHTTGDLLLASYLKASGVPLIDIYKSGARGFFVFDVTVHEELIKAFDLGTGRVEPRTFIDVRAGLLSALNR
jgi:hypothetical protein